MLTRYWSKVRRTGRRLAHATWFSHALLALALALQGLLHLVPARERALELETPPHIARHYRATVGRFYPCEHLRIALVDPEDPTLERGHQKQIMRRLLG